MVRDAESIIIVIGYFHGVGSAARNARGSACGAAWAGGRVGSERARGGGAGRPSVTRARRKTMACSGSATRYPVPRDTKWPGHGETIGRRRRS